MGALWYERRGEWEQRRLGWAITRRSISSARLRSQEAPQNSVQNLRWWRWEHLTLAVRHQANEWRPSSNPVARCPDEDKGAAGRQTGEAAGTCCLQRSRSWQDYGQAQAYQDKWVAQSERRWSRFLDWGDRQSEGNQRKTLHSPHPKCDHREWCRQVRDWDGIRDWSLWAEWYQEDRPIARWDTNST